MKIKRNVLLFITVLGLSVFLCSCGNTDAKTKEAAPVTEPAKPTLITETTITPTPTMPEQNKKDSRDRVLDITAEEALNIAEKGKDALVNGDVKGIIEYTNLLWYNQMSDENVADENMEETLKKMIEEVQNGNDKHSILYMFTQMDGLKLCGAEPLDEDILTEYKDFVKKGRLDEFSGETGKPFPYYLEEAYKISLDYSALGQANDGSFLVVGQYNGTWFLDVCISIMAEFYSSFETILN